MKERGVEVSVLLEEEMNHGKERSCEGVVMRW